MHATRVARTAPLRARVRGSRLAGTPGPQIFISVVIFIYVLIAIIDMTALVGSPGPRYV